MLWVLMLLMPFPYITNEAGWVVTEVGRQPWVIYGVMKTADGVSGNVAQGEVLFTLIGFLGMYALLGFFVLWMILREIWLGPEHG
jgi:cytochrome d ubiquinol oxidase subunit I